MAKKCKGYTQVEWRHLLKDMGGMKKAKAHFRANFKDAHAVLRELWKRHDAVVDEMFAKGYDQVGEMNDTVIADFAYDCFF